MAEEIIQDQQDQGSQSDWLSEHVPVNQSDIPDEGIAWLQEHEQVDSDLPEKAAVLAGTATKSALKPVSMTGGFLAGAGAGAPLGPVGSLAGGLLGAGMGYYGAEAVERVAEPEGYLISPEKIPSLPEGQRSYAYAGEVLGTGISMVGAPVGLARTGIRAGESFVGKWFNGILNSAQQYPKAFLTAETSALTTSAMFAGGAEEIAPGETGLRIGAEVVGGIFNVPKIMIASSHKAINQIRRVTSLFSPSTRQSLAGKYLIDTLEEYGEDPALVIRMLKEKGLSDLDLTAAQKTGSPTLGAIEKQLMSHSDNFGAATRKKAEDAVEGLKLMFHTLNQTGDPEAIVLAAKLRRDYFKTLITSGITQAEHDALMAASKISGDVTKSMDDLSIAAHKMIKTSLKQSRKAETELWKVVPDKLPGKGDNILKKYASIRDQLLPEETIDPLIEEVVSNINARAKSGDFETTGHLKKLRSRLLRLADEARNNKEPNKARMFGELSNAVLDDLNDAFSSGVALSSTSDALDNYKAARDFSRELNGVYTKKFVGRAMATGKYGDTIPPEVMLERAFPTSATRADLQFQELEQATRFIMKPEVGASNEAVSAMLDAQEQFIRLTAEKVINPETGRASSRQIAVFMKKYKKLLDRFPGVRDDLQNAMGSEEALTRYSARYKVASDKIRKEAAFSKFLDDDPIRVASNAISDPSREKLIGRLYKVANRGGEDGVAGFRAALFDAAIQRNTNPEGLMNFKSLRSMLFDPPVPRKKPLITIMKETGLLSDDQVENIAKIFEQAIKLDIAKRPGEAIDIADDIPGALTDLLLSVGGATIATKTAGATGPLQARGLIVAGKGASAARSIFNKIPANRIKDVLILAMDDPKFAADLMESAGDDVLRRMEKIRLIHAALYNAGIIGTREVIGREQNESMTTVED